MGKALGATIQNVSGAPESACPRFRLRRRRVADALSGPSPPDGWLVTAIHRLPQPIAPVAAISAGNERIGRVVCDKFAAALGAMSRRPMGDSLGVEGRLRRAAQTPALARKRHFPEHASVATIHPVSLPQAFALLARVGSGRGLAGVLPLRTEHRDVGKGRRLRRASARPASAAQSPERATIRSSFAGAR